MANEQRRLNRGPTDFSNPSLLLVVSTNRRRGGEVFGQQLGTGLADLGWNVHLAALWAGGDAATIDVEPLFDEPPRWRLDPRIVFRLRRKIGEQHPSVVFANGGATLRYAIAAMTAMRRRPMLAYASIGEPRFWTRSPSHAAWVRFLHRRADLVLAVSDETRRQLTAELGLPPERVVTAHTGVAGEFFELGGSDSAHAPLRVLFLGNLSEEKDPLAALRVVAALSTPGGFRLRFVGAGPLRDVLEREAQRLSLWNDIEFTGSVTDVRPQLSWADVLLLTSRTEGFPGVVLEAAAARVPSVAFAVGGTEETIAADATGILVNPGDVQGAARALIKLRDDPELLAEMGEKARISAMGDYTLERSVQRHDAIITAALRARGESVGSA